MTQATQNPSFSGFMLGETSLLVRCAEYWLTQGHQIQGICSPDPEVISWAKQKGLGCFTQPAAWLAVLQEHSIDYLFSIVNGWVIPAEALKLPRKAAINFHDSLLPRYAGVHSTTHALRRGEQRHGVTWHEMKAEIDSGDILQQLPVDIVPDDTALSLNLKCYAAAFDAFVQLVQALSENRLKPRKQDLSQRSYYGLWQRPEAACAFNWAEPAEHLDALVRSLSMGNYRNAVGLPKLSFGGQILIPQKAKILDQVSQQPPGTMLALHHGVLQIATSSKDLAVEQLTSVTGESLPIAAWLERCGLSIGARLASPSAEQWQALTTLDALYCRHEPYWTRQLAALTPLDCPLLQDTPGKPTQIQCPPSCDAIFLTLSLVILLARLRQNAQVSFGFSYPALMQAIDGFENYFARHVPFNLQLDMPHTFAQARLAFEQKLLEIQTKGSYLQDLALREPSLKGGLDLTELPTIVWLAPEQAAAHDAVIGFATHGGRAYWPAAWQPLLGHFQQLLMAILAYPDLPLAQLPLLDAQTIAQLQDWNSATMEYPQQQTVVDWFEQQAAQTPDNIALRCESEILSYAELNLKSNQLAHYLFSLSNDNADKLLAICIERSPTMLVSLLAVLKAGAAYVPIDPSYPPARILAMLQDSRAPCLLSQSHLRSRLPLAELTHTCRLVCIDEIDLNTQAANNPALAILPKHLAYVIYTSGSTGVPKGVMIEHRALALHLQAILQHYQPTADDKVLQFASLSFDISLEQLFTAWLRGGCVVLVKSSLLPPADLLALLRIHAVTIADIPPAYWQEMLFLETLAEALSALRILILGGEAVPSQLAQHTRARFPSLTIFNAYGPTEAAITPTLHRLPGALPSSATPYVSIGRARANTRVYILDANQYPLPPGVAGELCIAGEGLARGYLNTPQLTAEKFLHIEIFGRSERIYKTGDLARWLPDGTLDYLGRLDHQIKLRGYRIDLGEIEAALLEHPAVREAVAVVHGHNNQKRLIAYLTLPAGADANSLSITLKAMLAAQLPNYMQPNHLTVLKRLPLTPNGKIDRIALAALVPASTADHYAAPASALEQQLAEIWQNALEIERIGVLDDFFDLGGNSLLGLRLISELQNTFNTQLGIHDLFEMPNIRSLAGAIEQNHAASSKQNSIQPIPRDGRLFPVVLEAESLCKMFRAFGMEDQLFWMPFHLNGKLDLNALQQAFDAMLQRHEPLRTRLILENAEVWQRIEPFQSFSIPLLDFSKLDAAKQRKAIATFFAEARFKALEPGYLIDSMLIKLGEEEHIFAYCIHYFSFDDQAITLFNQEFTAFYQGFRQQQPISLPELPIQNADFAVWIKQQFAQTGDEPVYGAEQLARFKGSQCPCDFAPNPENPPQPVMKKLIFDAKTAQAFAALNTGAQTTALMISTLLLHILLHRLTGQNQIISMADFDYRNRQELKGILGHYAMSAYICTDFSGDPSFIEMLERGKQSMRDFYRNIANLKYCKQLLDDLIFHPENTAFSDVCCLAVTRPEFFEPSLPLAGVKSVYAEAFPYTFYIHFYLHLTHAQGRLLGSLNYDRARFKAETPHRMVCQFKNILNSVAANPYQPISQIPLLSIEDTPYTNNDLSDGYTQWQF
jgi:amino acid adenylation domain-containing protein